MVSNTSAEDTRDPQVADVEKGSINPNPGEPETQYPSGLKLALILLSNALAMFLVALVRDHPLQCSLSGD